MDMDVGSNDDVAGRNDAILDDATVAMQLQTAESRLERMRAELGLLQAEATFPLHLAMGVARDPGALLPNGRLPEPRAGSIEEAVKCVVCQEDVNASDTIELICRHSYCRTCLPDVFRHAMSTEAQFPARCCDFPISRGAVRPFLTRELEREYEEKTIEFETPNRTYCHNRDCGAFVREIKNGKAKCPKCGQVTCTECKEKEHKGKCIVDEDTEKLLKLGREKNWQRCYKCRQMVEMEYGCNHMTCRCGAEFCYTCGARYKSCACRDDPQNRYNYDNFDDELFRGEEFLQYMQGILQQPSPRLDGFNADGHSAIEQNAGNFRLLDIDIHRRERGRLAERNRQVRQAHDPNYMPRNPIEVRRQDRPPLQRQRGRARNQNVRGVNEHRERPGGRRLVSAVSAHAPAPGSGNEVPQFYEFAQRNQTRLQALVGQTDLPLSPIPQVGFLHDVPSIEVVNPFINGTNNALNQLPIILSMGFDHGRPPVHARIPFNTAAHLQTLQDGSRIAMELTVPPIDNQPAVIGTIEGVFRRFGGVGR